MITEDGKYLLTPQEAQRHFNMARDERLGVEPDKFSAEHKNILAEAAAEAAIMERGETEPVTLAEAARVLHVQVPNLRDKGRWFETYGVVAEKRDVDGSSHVTITRGQLTSLQRALELTAISKSMQYEQREADQRAARGGAVKDRIEKAAAQAVAQAMTGARERMIKGLIAGGMTETAAQAMADGIFGPAAQ